MTSELRPAMALWSDPSPPNDFCHYDHCSAKALFGTMRIEWKSWKDYPGYCLYFDAGETFIGSFDSLDQAKSHAAAIIEQDREAVRAEQDAEAVRLRKLIEATSAHFLRLNVGHPIMWEGAIDAAMEAVCLEVEKQAAELAKWKALAETLAGALEGVIDATSAYLPPDGISKDECINLVLGATDNPNINQALTSYKEQRDVAD